MLLLPHESSGTLGTNCIHLYKSNVLENEDSVLFTIFIYPFVSGHHRKKCLFETGPSSSTRYTLILSLLLIFESFIYIRGWETNAEIRKDLPNITLVCDGWTETRSWELNLCFHVSGTSQLLQISPLLTKVCMRRKLNQGLEQALNPLLWCLRL